MAVIKGIEVTIQVDGQALQEYDDIDGESPGSLTQGSSISESEDEDQESATFTIPMLTSNYVEAVSGARFSINRVIPESFKKVSDAVSFRVYLDGVFVQRNIMGMRLSQLRDESWSGLIDGSRQETKSGTLLRPFTFDEIKCKSKSLICRYDGNSGTVDENACLKQNKSEADCITDLGSIVVKAWRRKVLKKNTKRSGRPSSSRSSLLDLNKLDEKKLKGSSVTHGIRFAKEEKVSTHDTCDAIYKDGIDHPFAIFIFKYRSRKALQSLMLIPRTPSPTPPPPPVPLEERPVEELTAEELLELAMRQRARFQLERETNVKAEKGIKSERGTKREGDEEMEQLVASASSKKVKGPIAKGETVDLSD